MAPPFRTLSEFGKIVGSDRSPVGAIILALAGSDLGFVFAQGQRRLGVAVGRLASGLARE